MSLQTDRSHRALIQCDLRRKY